MELTWSIRIERNVGIIVWKYTPIITYTVTSIETIVETNSEISNACWNGSGFRNVSQASKPIYPEVKTHNKGLQSNFGSAVKPAPAAGARRYFQNCPRCWLTVKSPSRDRCGSAYCRVHHYWGEKCAFNECWVYWNVQRVYCWSRHMTVTAIWGSWNF